METSTRTYREMLIDTEHYTESDIKDWSEEDCKAEYQEISLSGE